MHLKFAICEDDTETLKNEYKLIDDLLKSRGSEYSLDSFDDPSKLMSSNTAYDIVFLDIEMGNINGIDVGKKLIEMNQDCCIFFITDYPAYIDKAFDIRAHRYLSKPMDPKRVSDGLDSALEKFKDKTKILKIADTRLKRKIGIPIISIVYIENIGRGTKIYFKSDTVFITDEVFSNVKKAIESEVNYFAMPHQSFFVNMHYVRSFDKDGVKLTYGTKNYETTVSRRGLADFTDRMFEYAKSCI